MTVYVLMSIDRHTDPEAYIFSTFEKALAFGNKITLNYGLVEPETTSTEPGWLWFQRLSYSEEDCWWITTAEIDATD